MAQQGSGFGKVVLYVVLGILGVFVGIQVLSWILGWIGWAIIIGVTIGVAYLVVKAGRRAVSGRDGNRQLPR